MSEQLAAEIWGELKRYVNTVDRAEAAENLVAILVDNDCDPDEIKEAFKGDADIKRALVDYAGNHDVEEYEEYEDEPDEYEDED